MSNFQTGAHHNQHTDAEEPKIATATIYDYEFRHPLFKLYPLLWN
jgi:hypothetical protein